MKLIHCLCVISAIIHCLTNIHNKILVISGVDDVEIPESNLGLSTGIRSLIPNMNAIFGFEAHC